MGLSALYLAVPSCMYLALLLLYIQAQMLKIYKWD